MPFMESSAKNLGSSVFISYDEYHTIKCASNIHIVNCSVYVVFLSPKKNSTKFGLDLYGLAKIQTFTIDQ